MKSLNLVLDALREQNRRIKNTGTNRYMAQCPAHDDNTPSLSILYRDGTTLITCHAHCQLIDICHALNIEVKDLFDESTSGAQVVDITKYLLANTDNNNQPQTQPVTPETREWVYLDHNSEPIAKTIKHVQSDGKKTFRQQHWNGTEWVNGLNGMTPPIYQLPAVQACIADGCPVVICEGEKDADSINQLNLNLIATTAPMGAGKWRPEHTEQLDGATLIYIIHDNDEPGINHAIKTAEALQQDGRTIHILTPKTGKDATDHINAGYNWADFINASEQFEAEQQNRRQARINKLTEEEIEKQTARDNARKQIQDTNAANRYQLPTTFTTLTQELAQPDHDTIYIIDQLWPQGANISLTATYKAGKTSTINNIIKSLADNQPLFGHYHIQHTGRIAVWNYEVSPNQIRRWLREVDITNTDNITLLNMRGHTWPINSQYVTDNTIQWLQQHNITTWIIDPLARAFVGSGDENSNQDVGIFLDTLDYIKDQAGVDNLLIAAHTGRNAEQGNNRARGASRFDDWVDARWMITKDAEGQRWFAADGRDVQVDESRLDWDNDNRTQTISVGIGKKQNIIEQTSKRVYEIIANAMPTGINRQGIINAYKAAFREESLSNESAETGILGQLQQDGLIYMEKIGNSKLFKVTNNQVRFDLM